MDDWTNEIAIYNDPKYPYGDAKFKYNKKTKKIKVRPYCDKPYGDDIHKFIESLTKAAEGLENVTITIESESGYYGEHNAVIIIEGYRDPTEDELVKINKVLEAEEKKTKLDAAKKAEQERKLYERLKKKYDKTKLS